MKFLFLWSIQQSFNFIITSTYVIFNLSSSLGTSDNSNIVTIKLRIHQFTVVLITTEYFDFVFVFA